MKKPETGIVVQDKAWMARFAAVMDTIPLDRGTHVFGIRYTGVHFQKDGVDVVTVAVIPKTYLRTYSQIGGSDFEVDADQVRQVEGLIDENAPRPTAKPR